MTLLGWLLAFVFLALYLCTRWNYQRLKARNLQLATLLIQGGLMLQQAEKVLIEVRKQHQADLDALCAALGISRQHTIH